MKNLTRLYAILAIAFATVLCYLVVDLYFNLSLPKHYLTFAIVCTSGFYASLTMYFFSKKSL